MFFSEYRFQISDKTEFIGEISFSKSDIKRTSGQGQFSNGTGANGATIIPANHPFNFWVANGASNISYMDPSIPANATNWANGTLSAVELVCACRPYGREYDGRKQNHYNAIDNQYFRSLLGVTNEISDTWSSEFMFMYAANNRTSRGPWNWISDK